MIRLAEHKESTENQPAEAMPLPLKVYIPLSQHMGKMCIPEVKAGDLVARGQRIASVEARLSSVIHASLSGKVAAIQEWPHPVLGRCKAVVIESDGSDMAVGLGARTEEEVRRLLPEQVRTIVFEAGIVGMGGASFPTHIKLNPPQPVDTLIINGAECEPYLTADYRLMLEKTGEILKGIEIIRKCLAVKNVYIAIEDNKPEAIKAFESHQSPVTSHRLKVLKARYPQGGEKQLIKNILRKEVPQGRLPFDIGVVVHNVATVFAIYEAAYLNKPLYERLVTVAGDCLSSPKNLWARIGTPVRELIGFCAPLKEEPAKIIAGGPMMGIAQFDLDAPVIKSTNGILFLSKSEAKSAQESLCIRCGRCIEYCPLGLMPCLIALSAEKEKWGLAKSYGCLDCMECGLCSYVCPQKVNIVQLVKYAKARMPK